jgi:acetate CoA/acetoacetate CoA-transferase beta subunit
MEDVHLTDAAGAFVSALPGAVAFASAMPFALIRGGHLDATVLGERLATCTGDWPIG